MARCGAGVTTEGHCCWLKGVQCPFLTADLRCSIRADHSSWAEAHEDRRYLVFVKSVVNAAVGVDCGDWPRPGEKCNECGVTG